MDIDFSKTAPYLQDPLVLIGFFLLVFFSFARFVVRQRLIPKLDKKLGYRVLQAILLYGFIIGLIIIALGFGLKYRELSRQEQQNAVSLLAQEFSSNLGTVAQLTKNTETLLQLMSGVAIALRHPEIQLLPILFPEANLDLSETAASSEDLANAAMDSLAKSVLHLDPIEIEKVTAAGRAVRGTVKRTVGTVKSLADASHSRYQMSDNVWQAQLPMLRKVNIFSVPDYQASYTELRRLRANYDVLTARVVDYLESLDQFFTEDQEISRDRLAATLAAERLAFQIVAAYGVDLAESGERLIQIRTKLERASEGAPNTANRADG